MSSGADLGDAGYALPAALITMLPGPDTAVVLNTAIKAGRGAAARAAGGIGTGLLIWGVAAAAGLAAALRSSAFLYDTFRLTCAAYLLILAVQALRASRQTTSDPATTGQSSGGRRHVLRRPPARSRPSDSGDRPRSSSASDLAGNDSALRATAATWQTWNYLRVGMFIAVSVALLPIWTNVSHRRPHREWSKGQAA